MILDTMARVAGSSSSYEPTTTYWVCFAVALVSALISLGYSLVALRTDGRSDVYAQYAASRSVAVLCAVASAGVVHSTDLLVVVALMTALMQAIDAVVGLGTRDPAKIFGPAGVAVTTVVVTSLLIAQV